MVLGALSECAGFIGRIVVGMVGVAWNLACYFVVPVLAFEDLSPGSALYRSCEEVVDSFSLRIFFVLLMLPGTRGRNAASFGP
jgi:hypothetical protein